MLCLEIGDKKPTVSLLSLGCENVGQLVFVCGRKLDGWFVWLWTSGLM